MKIPTPPYDLTAPELAAWQEYYAIGHRNGHGIACHNVPRVGDKIDRTADYWGLGPNVTLDNAKDYHQALCYAAEANARDYSPFEFTAKELNGETLLPAETAWDAYDSGVADAIGHDLSSYTDEDYL
jgi:hypothetical protein